MWQRVSPQHFFYSAVPALRHHVTLCSIRLCDIISEKILILNIHVFIGDNEDEEGGGSGYDEDGLEFFESEGGLFRIPGLDRNNEDILMIQYSEPDPSGSGPLLPWNTNTFPLPFGIFEEPVNGNDNTGNRTA